ncbi:MAG: hypothetical protein JO210_15005 [Acidobacteriaceae bacterium]|nr:hypothetical protein [Acidobacteriaceae bacterium]
MGLGPTKTLAKVANWMAKKRPEFGGVCDLRSLEARAELLSTVPLAEVWGIGKASAERLAQFGVTTAADLAAFDPSRARRLLTVVGARIVYELRGISCLPLSLLEPTRQGLAVTRSFGRPITEWREMSEALVTYAMRAGEKLREHHVAANDLTAFFHTSAFRDDPWYSDAATGQFLEATNDSQEIVRRAVQLGERIWRDGFPFAKAGVLLHELVSEDQIQPSFLAGENRERQMKLWESVDEVNHKLVVSQG